MAPFNLPVETFTSIVENRSRVRAAPAYLSHHLTTTSMPTTSIVTTNTFNCHAEPPDTVSPVLVNVPKRRRCNSRHQITSASDTLPQLDGQPKFHFLALDLQINGISIRRSHPNSSVGNSRGRQATKTASASGLRVFSNLYDPAHNMPIGLPPSETLMDGLISQLNCVIDENHFENCYFVFGDLSAKFKSQFLCCLVYLRL
ncbi:hypothetical protein V1520DRAFT_350769 [Lipomyces starkeyi]|uniref:Uncharacterized protein n=1 Tax=Lipomyces starkeyi NRRL Y-11557 TaxID=675824 RepID=A0A1E3Q6W1_LIPST|nr:hypothetical protein LIPSTDRAFT_71753 [Lipomyces starkeyi NRRL Y-11557]